MGFFGILVVVVVVVVVGVVVVVVVVLVVGAFVVLAVVFDVEFIRTLLAEFSAAVVGTEGIAGADTFLGGTIVDEIFTLDGN